MQSKNCVSSVIKVALCTVVALGFVATAQAQKADPNGTWSWTRPGRNGGADVKMTLKLKAEGEKLTGKLTTPGRQGGDPVAADIKDGKIKGDEISFTVVREFGGNTMTSKYTGKVTADSIKGKVETDRNGQSNTRDWEAKRDTEKK